MAKNKKPGAPAPNVTVENPNEEVGLQKDMNGFIQTSDVRGLSPDSRVALIKMNHERFFMDPMAAQHNGLTQAQVNSINEITACMQIAATICEVAIAKNTFTMLMPVEKVKQLIEFGSQMGIHLNTKMLPKPNAEGLVEVKSDDIKIDKDVKQKAKEEVAIMKKGPELDPSKISTDEQLREAIIYTLADTKTNPRPYGRINAAIDLFKSYNYFHTDDEAEKKKIADTDRSILLHDMIVKVGSCPFSIDGFAKMLYDVVATTKSPVSAFCIFRRNSSIPLAGEKVTVQPVDDTTVANFTKNLIIWVAESKKQQDETSIKGCEKAIELLNKNKKQNAEAIKKEKEKIQAYKDAIASYDDVINIVVEPSQDIANNFREAYDDKENDNWKTVHRIAANIMDTYYPKIENRTEIEHESFLHNIQQHIGKITNLFIDPASQDKNYVDSVISEFVFVKSEEKTEEKEEKK